MQHLENVLQDAHNTTDTVSGENTQDFHQEDAVHVPCDTKSQHLVFFNHEVYCS